MRDLEMYTGLPNGRKKTRRGRGHGASRETGHEKGAASARGSEDRGRARMAEGRDVAEGTRQSPSTGAGSGGARFNEARAVEDSTESPSTGSGTGGAGVHPATAHLHAAVMAHNAGDHYAAKTHALNYAHMVHVTTPTEEQTGGAPAPQHFNLATGEISDSDNEPDERRNHDVEGAHWIQGMHMQHGALHRELGVPEGQKIPAKKLARAAHSSNPTEARRAHLAETLKKMHHG